MKLTTVLLVSTLAILSCSKRQETNTNIADKISELKEFKVEEKRIDSLKQAGLKVDITISIIDASLDAEDKGQHISTAYIVEDLGFSETILYEVRFNTKTREILSVKRNKKP